MVWIIGNKFTSPPRGWDTRRNSASLANGMLTDTTHAGASSTFAHALAAWCLPPGTRRLVLCQGQKRHSLGGSCSSTLGSRWNASKQTHRRQGNLPRPAWVSQPRQPARMHEMLGLSGIWGCLLRSIVQSPVMERGNSRKELKERRNHLEENCSRY